MGLSVMNVLIIILVLILITGIVLITLWQTGVLFKKKKDPPLPENVYLARESIFRKPAKSGVLKGLPYAPYAKSDSEKVAIRGMWEPVMEAIYNKLYTIDYSSKPVEYKLRPETQDIAFEFNNRMIKLDPTLVKIEGPVYRALAGHRKLLRTLGIDIGNKAVVQLLKDLKMDIPPLPQSTITWH